MGHSKVCSPHRPKRRRLRFGSLQSRLSVATAAVALLVSGCGASAAESDAVTIVMGDSFNLTHPIGVGGTEGFIEALESSEAQALGFELEYYENGQMGKQRDMLNLLRSDTLDIAALSPAYVGPQLQLSNVGDLPGFVSDACIGGNATMDMLDEGGILYEEEWEPRGVKALWPAVIPDYEAMTGSSEVFTPEQLSGMVLRSTGGAADRAVDEVEAAGVSMPLGELYEAISRGTVDGTVASPISIAPYRLGEVLGYSTSGARLGAFTVTYSMSLDFWNSLNEEQQRFIDEISAEAQQGACEQMQVSLEEGLQTMREDGVQIHEVTDDERQLWDELAEPTVENWVQSLESIGLPSRAVVDDYTEALERHRDE